MENRQSDEADPALKAALKNAFGSDAAPTSLRGRVMVAMAAATAADATVESHPRPARWSLKRLLTEPMTPGIAAAAIAAILLLAIGAWYAVDALQSDRYPGGWRRTVDATPQPYPSAVAVALVARHEAFLRGETGGQTIAAGADVGAGELKAAILEKLGRTPWIADVRPAGWTLTGAKITRLDQVAAAHLLYRKTGASLSVISMPAPPSCDSAAFAQYQGTLGSAAFAGFTCNGNLYSMVHQSEQPGGPALAEVTRLRDQFHSEILSDADACPAPHP